MDNVVYALVGATGILAVLVAHLYAQLSRLRWQVAALDRHHGLDPTRSPELSERVKELARDPRRKIEAIKAVRDETGAGLALAKELVEAEARKSRS